MDTKDLQKYMDLNYPIEIRYIHEDEGGGVSATIPFLGSDAFVGDGETINEALENLKRVKGILFKYYLENNIKIPLPPKTEDYSGKFVLRLPKYLHQELVEKAKEEEVSLNTFCVSLLSQKIGNISFKNNIELIIQDLKRLIKSEFYEQKQKEVVRGPARYVLSEGEYGQAS